MKKPSGESGHIHQIFPIQGNPLFDMFNFGCKLICMQNLCLRSRESKREREREHWRISLQWSSLKRNSLQVIYLPAIFCRSTLFPVITFWLHVFVASILQLFILLPFDITCTFFILSVTLYDHQPFPSLAHHDLRQESRNDYGTNMMPKLMVHHHLPWDCHDQGQRVW